MTHDPWCGGSLRADCVQGFFANGKSVGTPWRSWWRRAMVADAMDPAPEHTATQRLHVALGPECNNNCLFCMEEDRASRRRINGALTAADVHAILESGRDVVEVCFTSGEPTLVDELPELIARARELGIARISVTTNGRRLSYPDYCERLVRAGANRFYVSVHGHQAKVHDGLVRTPGAFEQTVAGIRQLATLGIELHTCTIIARQNLPYLADIYGFLRDLGAHQVVFNVLQPNGRADTHFDRVVPRYADVAAAFVALLEGISEERAPAFLVDIPACTVQAVPEFHRGWVEPYVHHEVSDGEERLVQRSRAEYDARLRSKREPCGSCVYDDRCPGVWDNYLARFGWEEFPPVLAPTLAP